jgi:hypothetical protein
MNELARIAQSVNYAGLPARYARAMRAYLERGDLPEAERELRLVLEGNVAAALSGPGVWTLAVCRLSRWIDNQLPPCAHGNRDQVQLWIVYVRRARGRAMLAAMEGSPDADAPSEAAP